MTQQVIGKRAFLAVKSWCPYCIKAVATLKRIDPTFDNIEYLDQEDDGERRQAELTRLTGQRTVPFVFIGNKFIGGNSDLQEYSEAQLREMLLSS